MADDGRLRRHAHQRRLGVPGVGGASDLDTRPAAHRATLFARLRQRMLHRVEGGLVDQRTDQHAGRARITDAQARPCALQPRQQIVVHVSLGNHTAGGRAALAGGAIGTCLLYTSPSPRD